MARRRRSTGTTTSRAEVRHQGELLGALSVAMPPNDPMNPSKERLVHDLAAQAGLVLRNERLTSALKARLADLQAAQKRLVAAQDHERRKLERNIHDGAQQQLVALQVRQRLAEQLVDRDPAKAKAMSAELQIDTGTALDDLRDLARGIYPPLLADKGSVAALWSRRPARSPVPVTIEADGVGRYPAGRRGRRVLLGARGAAEHREVRGRRIAWSHAGPIIDE